jgi:hypothetical protein
METGELHMATRTLQAEMLPPQRGDRLPRTLAYALLAAMTFTLWSTIYALIYTMTQHR